MSDKIQLEVVTPEGRALVASVDEVVVPSVEGEFGVLPGHLPLLAALRTGLVTYRQGADTKRCAVGRGFVEAGPNKVVMLTHEYAERSQVDPVLVRKDLAQVQAQLATIEHVAMALVARRDGDGIDPRQIEARDERQALVVRENWLATQLELYGDPPPATQQSYEEFGPVPPPAEDEVPLADASDLPPHNETK